MLKFEMYYFAFQSSHSCSFFINIVIFGLCAVLSLFFFLFSKVSEISEKYLFHPPIPIRLNTKFKFKITLSK